MVPSAAGFAAQPLGQMFAPLYRVRDTLDPGSVSRRAVQWCIDATTRLEPLWDAKVVQGVVEGVQWSGRKIQHLQHGDFRVYCLYVVATLVVLLLVAV